jgi:GMP synthase-like glutamine amidotransferase
MAIGILLCGDIPAALEAEFGSYGDMLRRLVGPRETEVFDVRNGGLPACVDRCEAYLVSGSYAGVYDDLPWIRALQAFLRDARGVSKLVGVCFGHQVMAEAFGGAVVKSPNGWGIGLHRYELTAQPRWIDDADPVAVPAAHQDQVVAAPPDAQVIARSAFTPIAGLDYGDAISFQFHPEFSAAFSAALIDAERHLYGAAAEPAIRSHAEPDDCARVERWIGSFLDGG